MCSSVSICNLQHFLTHISNIATFLRRYDLEKQTTKHLREEANEEGGGYNLQFATFFNPHFQHRRLLKKI
jgi:hypothetical protein